MSDPPMVASSKASVASAAILVYNILGIAIRCTSTDCKLKTCHLTVEPLITDPPTSGQPLITDPPTSGQPLITDPHTSGQPLYNGH